VVAGEKEQVVRSRAKIANLCWTSSRQLRRLTSWELRGRLRSLLCDP
jgi:hypothetical protein